MCGLLALLSADGNAAQFVQPVERALPCMHHRGPDAAGTWSDDDAVFGFNRLAIIDIEHSHQPLRWGPEDNPARYALTFNGEIYNYVELREELQAALALYLDAERDLAHSGAWDPACDHWLRDAEAARTALAAALDQPLGQVLAQLTELEIEGQVSCDNGLWSVLMR